MLVRRPGERARPGERVSRHDRRASRRNRDENKKHKLRHFVAAWRLCTGGMGRVRRRHRAPQLATMVEAAGGAVLVVAFTVRDERREKGFALNDIGGAFWLRLRRRRFDTTTTNHHHASARRAARLASIESATRERAYVAGARRDLLVFEGGSRSDTK